MSEHHASIEWSRDGRAFVYETYSRQHTLCFDGGITLPGNGAPENIPRTVPPAPGVDPEQAVGVLAATWISKVTLRPVVSFSGKAPSDEEHRALHHKAHEKCYIADSVKSEVLVEPRIA